MLEIMGIVIRAGSPMPVFVLSELSIYPSWTCLLGALAWLIRLKGTPLVTKDTRPFVTRLIGGMAAEEPWYTECEATRMPQYEGASVVLPDSGGSGQYL